MKQAPVTRTTLVDYYKNHLWHSPEWVELLVEPVGNSISPLKALHTDVQRVEEVEVFPKPVYFFECFRQMKPDKVNVVIVTEDVVTEDAKSGMPWRHYNAAENVPEVVQVIVDSLQEQGYYNSTPYDAEMLSRWIRAGIFRMPKYLSGEKGIPDSHKQIWFRFVYLTLVAINKPVILVGSAKVYARHLKGILDYECIPHPSKTNSFHIINPSLKW